MTPDASAVWLLYTNHRGVTAWRHVRPKDLRFGESPWHPGRQWLLEAWAFDRGVYRTFALAQVLRWQADAPERREEAEDPLGRLARLEAWRDAVVARSVAAGRQVPGEGLCDWFEGLAREVKEWRRIEALAEEMAPEEDP